MKVNFSFHLFRSMLIAFILFLIVHFSVTFELFGKKFSRYYFISHNFRNIMLTTLETISTEEFPTQFKNILRKYAEIKAI